MDNRYMRFSLIIVRKIQLISFALIAFTLAPRFVHRLAPVFSPGERIIEPESPLMATLCVYRKNHCPLH